MKHETDDFAGCRTRWLLGRCPCCGGAIIDWEQPGTGEVVQSRLIAESVMICGRCIANHHLEPPEFAERLLASLVPPSSAPGRPGRRLPAPS